MSCKQIYVACFSHPMPYAGDVMGAAMCECGEFLTQHLSSSEDFSKHDMGITSDWKHETYREHCGPEFKLDWVARESDEWKRTLALNRAKYPTVSAEPSP